MYIIYTIYIYIGIEQNNIIDNTCNYDRPKVRTWYVIALYYVVIDI